MFKLLEIVIFFALACLAIVQADPLVDIPYTSMDLTVSEKPNYSRQVAIAIDRVDDLIGENGDLVAAKFSHVVLNFEITKNQIKLNGIPIEMGTSNLKIDASLAITPEAFTMSPDQVLEAFDQGVVGLQVTATRDRVYNSTLHRDVDRVTLEEIITEINGCEVVQTDISQQIVDLDNAGSYLPLLRGEFAVPQPNVPLMPDGYETDPSDSCNFPYHDSKLHSWIHQNPEIARASALVTLMVSGFLACFVLLPLLVYRRFREDNGMDYLHDEEYAKIVQYEAELEDEKFDQDMENLEDLALMR